MSESNKILKNTSYLTGAFVIQKFLAFVYFMILARLIGVDNVGKYSFALSYALIWAVFMDWGISTALVKELSQKAISVKQYLRSLLIFKGIMSLSVFGILCVSVYFSDYDASSKVLVYWAGVVMVVDSFAQTFYAVLRSQQLLKYEAVGLMINQFTIMALGILASVFFPGKLYLLLGAFLAGATVNNIVSLYGLRKNNLLQMEKSEVKMWALWKKVLLFAWPFALSTIFTRVYSYLDSVLLKNFLDDKAVAWYSVAYKIPFALQFLPIAFAAAIFPAMSALFGKDDEKLKSILNYALFYLTMMALPMLVGIWVLAPDLIHTFYGVAYEPAIAILRILVLGLFFIFINFPLGTAISSIGLQKYNTLFIFITMVINVAVNVVLIPISGPRGAAIAFLCSHGALFLMSFLFLRKRLHFEWKTFVWRTIQLAIVSALMGAAVYWSKQFIPWFASVAVGAVVYAVLLMAWRIFTVQDLKQLWNMFRKKDIQETQFESTYDDPIS